MMTKYRFNIHFFYLCSWRHLVSGVALGFLGYILGAVFATIARSHLLNEFTLFEKVTSPFHSLLMLYCGFSVSLICSFHCHGLAKMGTE